MTSSLTFERGERVDASCAERGRGAGGERNGGEQQSGGGVQDHGDSLDFNYV